MAAPIGNQNAKKAKRWQDALVKALAQYVSAERKIEAGQALDKIATQVVEKALDGDKDSIAEIGNRLDGKPAQAIIGGDEDDPAIKTVSEILIRAVDAASDRSAQEGG